MSYNIILIGAGQLGSRYLQGLSRTDVNINIYVLDPEPNALAVAKKRFENMQNSLKILSVSYFREIKNFNIEFDLAIIATTANVRKNVIKSLLAKNKIKNMILEKVVFQSIEDFNEISVLLNKNNISTWVNCPRRITPFFQRLKKEINKDYPIHIIINGNNWGLASNTIHILDLMAFLSGELNYLIDISQLDNQLYDSKRIGFIEFGGKLSVKSDNGDTIELFDYRKNNDQFQFTIEHNNSRFTIDQNKGIVTQFLNNKKISELEFCIPMHSELIKPVMSDIIIRSSSNLTSFKDSLILHRSMLKAFNKHLSNALGKKVNICPIT